MLAVEEQERSLTIEVGSVKAAETEAVNKEETTEKAEAVEAVKTPHQEEFEVNLI